MNNNQTENKVVETGAPFKKDSRWLAIGIAVIVIVVIAVAIFGKGTKPSATVDSMTATTTATSTVPAAPAAVVKTASTTAPALNASFIYQVVTDKKTYSQSENISMTVSVINNTESSRTFSFTNGCQTDYSIAGFDLKQHVRCTPAPTSFTVPPHKAESLNLVHYASVYKLPVGTWPLSVEIIGYGGATVPAITITN